MKPTYHPSLEEFRQLCGRGNVVPVYRQLMADALTPVLAFEKIAGERDCFLLESASGPENIGRFSILGSAPFAAFKSSGSKVSITEDGRERTLTAKDPLEEFGRYLEQFRLAHVPGLPRFSCGAVGYMAYDVVRFVEHLPNCPPDDRGLPDVYFMFFDQVLIFDHWNMTIKVVCSQRVDGKDPKDAYRDAVKRIDALVEVLRTPATTACDDIEPAGEVTLHYESNMAREKDLAGVEKARSTSGPATSSRWSLASG